MFVVSHYNNAEAGVCSGMECPMTVPHPSNKYTGHFCGASVYYCVVLGNHGAVMESWSSRVS